MVVRNVVSQTTGAEARYTSPFLTSRRKLYWLIRRAESLIVEYSRLQSTLNPSRCHKSLYASSSFVVSNWQSSIKFRRLTFLRGTSVFGLISSPTSYGSEGSQRT